MFFRNAGTHLPDYSTDHVRYVACMEETRSAYKSLVEKPEKMRPLRRRISRRESNIKIDDKEICLGREYVD
jgi:hypothetical protein